MVNASQQVSLQEVAHRLGERVKELNCLYGITRLVEREELSVDEILQGVVELIPPSWQYPEITCARIKLEKSSFQTNNYRATRRKQAEDIFVNGRKTGTLEICYLTATPPADEGPFLKEERNLIHVIAERLGHIIEHRLAQDSLQSLYEQEKKLRQQLQTEMQWRIDFTRNLIHELKTPLTALLATSQLLYEEETDGKLNRLAGYVLEGANSLNTRIDELHDVIKGEMGTLKLERKEVDMAVLLPAIVNETQALARQNGVVLRLKMAEPLPKVRADAARVRQIVLNLLNNAFKYAAEGGKVTINCTADDKAVKIEIKDRGPGIAAAEQQHLFAPGYQVNYQAEPAAGLGIGLALCRLLVELHGGKIWVKSRTGRGASFFFTLPTDSGVKDGDKKLK